MKLPFAEMKRTKRGVGLGKEQELGFGDKGKDLLDTCKEVLSRYILEYSRLVFKAVVWTHEQKGSI